MAPMKPKQPCSVPGCPHLKPCPVHGKRPWEGRPPANQRGYDWAWSRLRARVLKEQPYCAVCGKPATSVHHRVPRSRRREDLIPLCKIHHDQATAKQAAAARRRA